MPDLVRARRRTQASRNVIRLTAVPIRETWPMSKVWAVAVLAAATALGTAGCASNSATKSTKKPTTFEAMCNRGRPDRHRDITASDVDAAPDSRQQAFTDQVKALIFRCCPDTKRYPDREVQCVRFADISWGGTPRSIGIDLGRRASHADREVVATFVRRFGFAREVVIEPL